METTNSDKSGNGSETINSVEQIDSEEPNHLKAKQSRGQRKRHHVTGLGNTVSDLRSYKGLGVKVTVDNEA